MKKSAQHFLYVLVLMNYILLSACSSEDNPREITDFNLDWKFSLGDFSEASEVGFDDADWRVLELPHDWSIESSFSEDHPTTPQGGALPAGKGWYRKAFTVPENYDQKEVWIEFDGVYRNSEVWINGHYHQIEAIADRTEIDADGKDLSFITIKVLDEYGNLVPRADNLINFEVTGPGKIVGVDNGYQASLESFKSHFRKAFNGMCLVIIQSERENGTVTLLAKSEGLEEKKITIQVR